MAVRIKEFRTIMNEDGFPVLVQEMTCNYEGSKKMSSPDCVVSLMNKVFDLNKQCEEYFFMLALTTKNIVKGVFRISHGSLAMTVVHPREVFVRAILCQASAIIVVHNHPSGDPEPSPEDLQMTNRLSQAGKLLGITLCDHIIIAGDEHVSIAERHGL